MGLNDELHVFYTFREALLVSEEYYSLELKPARKWSNFVKGVGVAAAAVATSAALPFVDELVALTAALTPAVPYVNRHFGISDARLARLDELWTGYKAHREAMDAVLADLQMARSQLSSERTIPAEIREKRRAIEDAVQTLSRKDEPLEESVRIRATEIVRARNPPSLWWYVR